MEILYRGKTKDVLLYTEDQLLLRFKDSVTGSGKLLDPGGNEVVGRVAGKGGASLRLSVYFFKLLEQAGIPTHYLGPGPEENCIVVKKARSFGLEVICREKAWGSFVRRYGKYAAEGMPLPSLVEFTLKDDERGDPPITVETLAALQIASPEEAGYMKKTAQKATALIKKQLFKKGLELVDIKYEFGEAGGRILLIDEISGDSMRVLQNGRVLLPHEPAAIFLGSGK
ncbi:MAG TPA: phosphoribosylaminoimidazolesuccinocarboxamide synthase [Bacillota bacterium]|jgi:phosphoribosylaminoimidazole-succinocarboxamide synthase|nr:phosphoribosylaminoimidazolesuccinocarboxamide synthase [Bacillota bacterium]HOJ84188.1 phosphoribosylaminoimidazolesuccinocarboxamide synthase [Bacillota bacterium]HOL14608.1 phosphoribosylaminoimidazolesuccinocarboxamide synthase [Bacillota bacterium]HPZ10762.1 phosphoribosylaminoimidazolesuccinocarboxamide synthase [Bacillota bacterium]HQE08928.1 phosphoribosylaminoimidazolesuccinocarboxamide synthase [Bacillota bacterium]